MVIALKLPLLLCSSLLVLASALDNVPDLIALESIAKDHKAQSVESGSSGKYGYPYRIAPTLTPNIQARSDDEDENEAVHVAVPVGKPYGSRISAATDSDVALKKGNQKKSKTPYTYGATRRRDNDDEKYFRSYKEPKYRNFDELEVDFRPRRMDIDIPYSQYEYRKPRPNVSPIDPYLTPSAAPGDAFYPVPKIKTYPSSSYGHGRDVPSYGAGRYEDPVHYGSYGGPSPSYPSSGGPPSSYPSSGGPSSSYSSSGGPSPNYPSSGGPSSSYPSSGGPSSSYSSSGGPSPSYPSKGQYDYHDNYSIKSNEPIMGNIRKKLLNYAGASDLYEGEPDYLRQVSRSKYKYGNIGNDYYSYGGPAYRDSYREFPYVESKIMLIKKSRGL